MPGLSSYCYDHTTSLTMQVSRILCGLQLWLRGASYHHCRCEQKSFLSVFSFFIAIKGHFSSVLQVHKPLLWYSMHAFSQESSWESLAGTSFLYLCTWNGEKVGYRGWPIYWLQSGVSGEGVVKGIYHLSHFLPTSCLCVFSCQRMRHTGWVL
jgi:hypothetical protein